VKSRAEELAETGLEEAAATNTAWMKVDFEDRYSTYLAESDVAREHADSLIERVANGEAIALVCFEADEKRCHRRVLADVLRPRLER
jgi:uncharacterized protein YeaO (DUF488 family)